MVMNKMAAYPDDRIETHSDKHASVTLNGNSIVVLGNSNLKLEANAAELVSGGTVVKSSTQYVVHSSCFSVQPAGPATYSVVPYQGRIYIHAEQGDIIVKTRREMRVPAGKTVAIAACGKPAETLDFAGNREWPYKLVFGGATGAGIAVIPILPRNVSAECPHEPCH